MLNQEEFQSWCVQLGLKPSTVKQIEQIRSSPPSRRVRSVAGNVSGRYPSQKMGVTIQFESHRNELAGIYEMEYDRDVLEYYDQPAAIKLCYQGKNGRGVGVWHTADFFVIRQGGAGWEEWKTAAALERLAEQMPQRYIKGASGQWRCPPGEQTADTYGLYYRLRCNTEIDWVVQSNLQFLEDYLRGEAFSVNEETGRQIWSKVKAQPGVTVGELMAQGYAPDDIYALVAGERLYVNLRMATIAAEPERVALFLTQEQEKAYTILSENVALSPAAARMIEMAVGSRVVWNGECLEILNVGQTHTALLSAGEKVLQLPNTALANLVKQGELTGGDSPNRAASSLNDLLSQASVAALAEANRRYERIAPYLTGDQPAQQPTVSSGTIRRWLRAWRQAVNQHGYGYVGLLPRQSERGNRQPKLPQLTQKLLDEFIANDYESLKQKGKFAVYGALVCACEQAGVPPPSYKTFGRRIKARPQEQQIKQRQGHRAAYQHQPFYWELELTTPRHGNRPLEIGHIDHTELDIELVSSRTQSALGRPWATFLSDAYSRRLLAVYLTFDPPSYRSCMMVIRECVRRHSRLPQVVVVDGGKEFQSVYFEQLLAAYECTKKLRPAAQPRFGSVCERLFGTANTMLIHNLQGNTQMTRNQRLVTPAVNPRGQAIWTLGSLYQHLCDWAYEFYDNKLHPTLGQSPRQVFDSGWRQSGWRPHRLIAYDETFRILTLPTTKKGTALVVPSQGVKIHHIYYWHNSFRHPEVERTQVPVRYDPYDAGTAYAYVRSQWVGCVSQHYSSFHGHSEREIMVATEELRQQHKNHSQQFTVTAKALAEFLASATSQEAVLLQRWRDLEALDVLAVMEGVAVNQHHPQLSPPANPQLLLTHTGASPAAVGINGASAAEPIEPYQEFW